MSAYRFTQATAVHGYVSVNQHVDTFPDTDILLSRNQAAFTFSHHQNYTWKFLLNLPATSLVLDHAFSSSHLVIFQTSSIQTYLGCHPSSVFLDSTRINNLSQAASMDAGALITGSRSSTGELSFSIFSTILPNSRFRQFIRQTSSTYSNFKSFASQII